MSWDATDLAARLRERLATGWTEQKIQGLSTATILEQLAACGIHTSTDEFARQAYTEHTAIALSETWRRRFRVSARGLDDDFIWMAACVLWERLLPERPSFELLNDRMQAGTRRWKRSRHRAPATCGWACGMASNSIWRRR